MLYHAPSLNRWLCAAIISAVPLLINCGGDFAHAPVFTQQPKVEGPEKGAGTRIYTLKAKTFANPAKTTYKWFCDGKLIPGQEEPICKISANDAGEIVEMKNPPPKVPKVPADNAPEGDKEDGQWEEVSLNEESRDEVPPSTEPEDQPKDNPKPKPSPKPNPKNPQPPQPSPDPKPQPKPNKPGGGGGKKGDKPQSKEHEIYLEATNNIGMVKSNILRLEVPVIKPKENVPAGEGDFQ